MGLSHGHFLADQRYGVNAYNQIEQPDVAYLSNGTNHPDICPGDFELHLIHGVII